MPYQYFEEFDAGFEKSLNAKRDVNLQEEFRYPLQAERRSQEEDIDVDIPHIDFHIVRIGMQSIRSDSENEQFRQLLSDLPSNLHLILDFDGVSDADESAIGTLVFLHKRMRKQAQLFMVNYPLVNHRLGRWTRLCSTVSAL